MSKKDPKLNVEVSLGSFLVHDIELILNSPLLSHMLYSIVKENKSIIKNLDKITYLSIYPARQSYLI
ncbi:hypothetical protein, partial [Streptococcus pneumoniae]|uniref:hypothetical protein n=1 Tax=Streptococcus pneumoniae TaxID=1313 RepID=UPI001C930A93